jgi:hypothetical protein
MENVLGILAFTLYVLVIVGMAAGVTWVVVRFTPSRRKTDAAAKN